MIFNACDHLMHRIYMFIRGPVSYPMGYMQGFILILLFAYILLGVFMHFIAYKKKQKNSLFEVGPSVPSPTKETNATICACCLHMNVGL